MPSSGPLPAPGSDPSSAASRADQRPDRRAEIAAGHAADGGTAPAGERPGRRPVRQEKFTAKVAIVLPAYNEQECIADAVADCLEFLPRCFERYEVVCVDDGSRDDTAAIVRGLERDHPGVVRGVYFERNQGYGAAIMAGFRAADAELLFFTDSDRQFDITELEPAVELLEGVGVEGGAGSGAEGGSAGGAVDAVFGFRVYRYDSVIRCFTSWVYNRLVRVLFGVKVRDVDCAFKLFRRDVIDRMDVACTDFFIDTELVARTAKLGCTSREMGVRHLPRTAGRTTVHPGHIPRTLMTVARMWLLIHFGIGRGRTIERDRKHGSSSDTA